jgi:hypothetical protein
MEQILITFGLMFAIIFIIGFGALIVAIIYANQIPYNGKQTKNLPDPFETRKGGRGEEL